MSEQLMPTLYTQHGCRDSAKVRRWLTEHGIAFAERNVTGDEDAARALLATGIFATPLLVVGKAKVIGFRPAELVNALEGSGG